MKLVAFNAFLIFSVTLLREVINVKENEKCHLQRQKIWTCNYIPPEIPDGVTTVRIIDFMAKYVEFGINRTLFLSDKWQDITYLEFTDGSVARYSEDLTFEDATFSNFSNLKELHMHLHNGVRLKPYSFLGLNNVRILDLSKCVRLTLVDVAAALNGSNKIPNLEQLILHKVNYERRPLKIDREFSRCLSQKPLFHLDLSMTRISVLELKTIKDLTQLSTFNLSGALITEIDHVGASPESFEHVDRMDMSYTIIDSLWLKYNTHIFYLNNTNIPFKNRGQHASFYLSPGILNISRVITYDISLNNIRFWSMKHFKSQSKGLIAMQNGLRRFDVDFVCDNFDFSSIEIINFAKNGLEFMHPSIFNCMFNIECLDLSDNNLNEMYIEDVQLFETLFAGNADLREVHLANNHFIDLPNVLFEKNENLEIINLAENNLTQVHFKLGHLRKLRVLNLSKNNIKRLDDVSMANLDALAVVVESNEVNNTNHETTTNVNIELNPLICDDCQTKKSIRWLSKFELFDTVSANLTCKSESGEQILVRATAEKTVHEICKREIRNTVIYSTSVVFSVLFISVIIILYMRRRYRRKQRHRNDIVNMLRQNNDRFAVFLSYGSDDYTFIRDHVLGPLNDGLGRIVDTERKLVCTGDNEFRFGRYVVKESFRCIESSCVVISFMSNNYCNSNYCVGEFDQALSLRKPILLMMKGEVDEELMTPAMRLLFRDRVRVLWEDDNGEYRLKSSWENVCESILALAVL